jgi:hypothetical protein
MSRPITSVSQAFYTHKTKDSMFLLFWSSDWYSRRPWSIDGNATGYVDKQIVYRDFGRMTAWMLGPLAIMYYRKHPYPD